MDFGRALERGPEFAGASVIATPVRLRRASIQRIAQELVAEVVVTRIDRAEVVQEPMVDQFLERRLQLGHRAIHHAGQDRRHEAAPEDRAGLRHGQRPGGATGSSSEDGVLDRVGDEGTADRGNIDGLMLSCRRDEFLDVERQAVRTLMDSLRDVAGDRQTRCQEQGRDGRRLVQGQSLEANLLGASLGQQSSPPLA